MSSQAANATATRVIVFSIAIGIAVFTLPSVLLLGVGMLPTFAAMLTDRRREKYATLCVGCMNFTGVLPFMIMLWAEDHSYDNAFSIIGDPFTWLVMFGAAAIGWSIFFIAPGFIGIFIGMRTEQRIERLRRRQRDLIEEWGPGVAGSRDEKDGDAKPGAARAAADDS